MTMRLFMATISTETNTFCSMPTAMSGFEEFYLRHGTATQEPPNLMTEALHVWRARAEAEGWEVTESLAAIAEPAGLTTGPTYEALRGEILSDLDGAGGADVVLLQLHGAMVAEGVEDCEGDILAAVRARCPRAVIGVALDLHCHLTARMCAAADLVITFKEYPHDDATPRAEELFDMARLTLAGEINPVMSVFDCRMLGIYMTKESEMARIVQEMHALEAEPGILSVSLAHGFAWADVADLGARVLVIADGDAGLAQETAERFGRSFYERRHALKADYPTMAEALDVALGEDADRPIVLADMGDNSGAGAPGDATFVLREILKRGLSDVALGLIWDPVVVRICRDAGEGATLSLRVGGKTSAFSGDPVDIEARVMRIASGLGQHLGPGLEPLGCMVWLRIGEDTDLVVNDLRTQVYHPEAFEQMGIRLAEKRLVVVKSTFHFYAPFRAIASRVIQVATPGGASPDFRNFDYRRGGAELWPFMDDPM
ncbi:M81 family metallopeptidase [Rhodobacteraceae bacterium KMM 6894]|nr:M81 family metallopeptidase [Rhodobacteraceae bacterium KMM 6894]